MSHTYELLAGGYRILADGVPYIDQPFDPAQSFDDTGAPRPFVDEAAARAHAETVIAELAAAA